MTQVNTERLVNHFCDLVKIDSESGNEKAVAEAIAEQLGELGFVVSKLPVPEQYTNGFNVYGRLKVNKKAASYSVLTWTQ
ncbi:peptidase M20A family [Vibrio maritimus]|uniref:Peptidase M20A family n=1 Tax=Vibrio maritimus TaxID=990268 RepID=A0A090RU71_9VIBR|nr:peptidase M20A family [Vibrio maritimus]